MITLAILNNQPVVRAGIHSMLKDEDGIRIVGDAENSSDVQVLVTQLQPRILLIDLKIPGTSPVEIADWVRINFPDTLPLVFSAQDKDVYLAEMMNAGAVGFLNTEISAEDLMAAIRRADKGETLFDDEQLKRIDEWQKAAGEKWLKLRKRQKRILQMLAEGTSKAEVAKQTGLSVSGVGFHIDTIKKILKVKSILESVNWLHKYFPENSGSIT
jgi:DNA-binding NarL/FixJ family response regulator